MVVQRKQNRQLWFSAVLNTIPDLLIAGGITLGFDGNLILFFSAFLALHAIYFALWLKNTIWVWLLYMIRDKKRITRNLVDFLVANKFPQPGALMYSAESYLDEVAANETIDVKTRLLAAAELGAISYVQSSIRLQEYIRLTMPYDEAIEEYNRKLSRA